MSQDDARAARDPRSRLATTPARTPTSPTFPSAPLLTTTMVSTTRRAPASFRSSSAMAAATALSALAAALPAQLIPADPFLQEQVFGKLPARSVGPSNFGGRVVDIEAVPDDPSTIYVVYGSSGLWKTTNAGTTWTPIFERQGVFSLGDLALAPSNHEVLYLGTGEANNQRSSYWGNGVHRSDDGGKTWRHVGLEGTDHIGRIVVHPDDPDTAYVAALGALYSPNPERGLYRTRDGGKSWDLVLHVSDDVGCVDVVLDPRDPNVLYTASYERRRKAWDFQEGGPGSGIHKSLDGGDTWTRLEGGLPGGDLGRIGLAIWPMNPDTVFAIVENLNPRAKREETVEGEAGARSASSPGARDRRDEHDHERHDDERHVDDPDGLYPFGEGEIEEAPGEGRLPETGGQVWRTDDGGATWKLLGDEKVGGEPHYYYGQIRVDPHDADRLYVCGVPVYTTSDGGKTWKTDFARGVHVDHHAIWIDPNDSDHVLLGNDGGFCVTRDGGAHWDYFNDLPLGQFYAVGVDDADPYHVFGGTQDNGSWGIPNRSATTRSLDASDAFKIGGGDGFYVAADPDDRDILYYESQFGWLGRLNRRTGERSNIRPPAEKGAAPLRFNWMSPLLLSPHDPQTLYYGSQHLHRSVDRGETWQTLSGDLSRNDPARLVGDVPHGTITTISESPLVPGLLYVGTDDGRVWLTRDGGTSGRFEELSDRFPGLPGTPPLWVSRVEASPSDADTVYVAFTGYREDLRDAWIYVSTDRGVRFRRVGEGRIPRGGINVVREHPRNANVLFVGHEFGASVSVDGGATWCELTQLPCCAVHDLLVHPREPDLVVGTHGRGIYVVDITPLEKADGSTFDRSFSAFAPRPFTMRARGFASIGYPGARGWTADDAPSRPEAWYFLQHDADAPVVVEVLDAAGTVLFETDGPTTAGLHRVAWQPERRGRGRGEDGGNDRPRRRAAPGHYAVRVRSGEDRRATFALDVFPPRDLDPDSDDALWLYEQFEHGLEAVDTSVEGGEEEEGAEEEGERGVAGNGADDDV
jgi:photosystem II stability/assembly factor-like uncharacterized protein